MQNTVPAQDADRAIMSRRHLLTSGAAVLGAAGVTAAAGATAPAAHAAGSGWYPIQFRSVDTRRWPFKPRQGDTYTLDLTNDQYDNWIITASAVAVSYNLTVTLTEGSGYLALWRYGEPFPNTSSLNWTQSGAQIANGGIVELGSSYYASLYFGGPSGSRAEFIVDITGYFA